jgi:hypothetical protein
LYGRVVLANVEANLASVLQIKCFGLRIGEKLNDFGHGGKGKGCLPRQAKGSEW